MKKKLAIIIPCAIAVCFILAGILFMFGKDISTGRCLVADNGSILWVDNAGNPVVLNDKTAFGFPQNLSSGDKIWFIHADAIAESYPGQVATYFCIKIADGTLADIPSETINSLAELEWLNPNESISNVGGADQPSNISTNATLLISSDEYYDFLKSTAEAAVNNTSFSKYSVGVGEYPYYEMVFVVSKGVDDAKFYESAESIAKSIFDTLTQKEYQAPPIYKYSYNNISIEFYTEANRNIGANCTYQFVIDKVDSEKTFEENVSILTQNK